MNVIDALVVTFGIDASEYEKKQKEIATSLTKMGETAGKQTKLIAESGKKAAGAFSALKIEILGALAAFGMGAGFKAFIESSMNAQAAAGRTADALGVSVQSLRAYKLMAAEMGESGDAAVGTLNKVAAGMAAARRGDISFLATANKYGAGLTMGDSVETAMSKLNRMAYAIRQKYGEQQAIGVLGEIGVSDQLQAIRMTQNPTLNAQDHAEAMRKVGVWTPQQIAQNQKLQKQWADFMRQMDNLKVKIANDIEPALIKLGDQFEKWVDSGGLDRLTTKLEKLFNEVQKIVSALGGVKGILIEIAAIKVFSWSAGIASTILQLRALTVAARAAKLAAGGAGVIPTTAGPAAAAEGKGFFSKLLGGSLLLRSLWTAAWAPRPEESPEQFKARIDAQNKKFNASHPGYENSSYWDKWKTVLGITSSPATHAVMSASGAIDRNTPNDLFAKLEKQNGLPAGLLSSIYSAESSRGKNLVSPKGARGPFQFMPGTAADYGLHGNDVFDLNKSASAAASYLHDLMKMFNGNLQDAVAAYNWGPGNVMRKGLSSMPKETSDYLRRVLGATSPGARFGESAAAKSSTTDVHIGSITVQTKATDANGVAKGMQRALLGNPLIRGSVTSLT